MYHFSASFLAVLFFTFGMGPARGGERIFRGKTAREWASRIQNEDGDYSTEVIATLAEMGPDAKVAVPVLIRALGSPDKEARGRAALTLANIGPEAKAAIPVLVACLRDSEVSALDEQAQALALIGEAALGPLLDSLEDPAKDVRYRAACALGLMRGKAVPPLVARLRHKKAEVRKSAAYALQWMGADAREAKSALLGALKDPDREVRRRAVDALSSIDPRGEGVAVEIVKTLAGGKEYEHLLALDYWIALDTRGKEAVPALIPLLDSEDRALFIQACKFLGQIGPGAKAAVPVLEKQLRRGTQRRAVIAASTLLSLGPKGQAAWRAALRHPVGAVRFEVAVAGLGEKGVDEALLLPALLKGIKTKDAGTQEMAALGLCFLASRSASPRTRQDLAQWGTAAHLDALQHHKDPNARLAAARYLGGDVQKEAVVRALIRAMGDPDEEVRLQAVKSLGGLGPPAQAPLPHLWKLARTGENAVWKDEALRAVALITRDWRKVVPLLLRLEGEDDRLESILFGLELVAPRAEGFLVDLLQSREPARRRLAFRILGCCFSHPSEQLVPELVEALSDKDVLMRWQAANVLGKIGPGARAAVPVLLHMLKPKENMERLAAAYALARIGPCGEEACAALIAALDDEKLRDCAVVGLARMGVEARPARPRLVVALEDEDSLVRCGAAWALGNLGEEASPAVPALMTMLHSPDEGLQATAARTLGRIGPRARAAVPTLRALSTDPRIAIRRRIPDNLGARWTGEWPLGLLLPKGRPGCLRGGEAGAGEDRGETSGGPALSHGAFCGVPPTMGEDGQQARGRGLPMQCLSKAPCALPTPAFPPPSPLSRRPQALE